MLHLHFACHVIMKVRLKGLRFLQKYIHRTEILTTKHHAYWQYWIDKSEFFVTQHAVTKEEKISLEDLRRYSFRNLTKSPGKAQALLPHI